MYLNGPATEDRTFFDLGRWTTLPGGRLVLRANGGDVTRFSVASAGEIGLLDERGMAIDSDANLNLRAETGALEGFGPTTVRGMYTYFADAAILAPCNTRVRFPVAMIERHVDVEESYLENRSGPGAPLLVEIVARLEQVPAMEGDGTEEAVIVIDFQGAYPGASCFDEAALTDSTGWVLRELNGLLIERDDPEMIPSLTFGGDRITGSTGCNRLTGPFESSGREFRLGPLAMTRQACADTLESTFVAFLEDVESHQVFGDELELSSASGWVALLKKRGG